MPRRYVRGEREIELRVSAPAAPVLRGVIEETARGSYPIPMSRKVFLTIVACVALSVGVFALLGSSALLEGKGAVANDASNVMTREVGVLLLSVGLLMSMIRSHPDSPTLRAILIAQGTFAKLSGITANSVFHVLAATGFVYFASRISAAGDAASPTAG